MKKKKILMVVFIFIIAVLVGTCYYTYRELISTRQLLNMANEIDGEYNYLGRMEELEESDLSRYTLVEENADVDGYSRDFYKRRLSLSETGWEDFIQNIDSYQIHELQLSIYNDSDYPIRDIWLYSNSPDVIVQYDILYFKPVYVAPHSEFTNSFNVYIHVDEKNEGNAQKALENGTILYSIRTDYGACQKPARFCS